MEILIQFRLKYQVCIIDPDLGYIQTSIVTSLYILYIDQ